MRLLNFLILSIGMAFTACQPAPETITSEDYRRAERFLTQNTDSLVYGNVKQQAWQANNTLYYSVTTKNGVEYRKINPTNKEILPAFDQQKLAEKLVSLTKTEVHPYNIDLSAIVELEEGAKLQFRFSGNDYELSLSDYTLVKQSPRQKRNEILSPNGQWAAYIDSYNLWVRNTSTDEKVQLTFDGIEDYGYATDNAGWTHGDNPVLLWSPQSDKIATFRHDGRKVGEMYLWNTKVGHPELKAWKYPLPGDSAIFMIERVVLHLGQNPKMVKLKMEPDAHRSTTSDHIAGRGGRFLDVAWSKDGGSLAFVSSSRDHKIAQLKIADAFTGEVRSLHREETKTYFEGGSVDENWRLLKESNEFIWYSEKTDWGHLYLYNLETGELKNPITSGNWMVGEVLYIDQENRQLYFTGSNKEEGDPYFNYLYRINFDGKELENLTPENAHHSINFSMDNNFFVDSYGTPDTPPITIIRNRNGEELVRLAEGDISDLLATGWVPPIPFTVFARDSVTRLYGLMYKPSNFDPSKKYPILNYLYPGPQSGSVGSRSFRASRADKQSLAELGFIVVEVDALGSPGRSKTFHDGYYGNMGDNGLPDQIIMIRQLAAENSWMDLDKVGIWGHSGGGFASTGAILRYPDFYKVAVSGAGNHDNRNYEDDWGEKWQGLLVDYTKGGLGGQPVNVEIEGKGENTNYDNQANQLLAANLKGKLLIAHGMMDDNVHPSNTMLVVDALIKADKDFDLVVFPNARHGFGNSRYFLKRRWDYFVENLKGLDSPKDFVFKGNIK